MTSEKNKKEKQQEFQDFSVHDGHIGIFFSHC